MKARVFFLCLALVATAKADIDVRVLAGAVAGHRDVMPRGSVFARPTMSALIELPDGDDPTRFGLPRIGSRFSVAKGSIAELADLAAAHPTWRVTWSPPLRLLSDRAGEWSRAPEFRNETGLTGKGTFVGIIDAGFDVAHPDFRNADGTTRIAFFVDFSKKHLGLHPELESLCQENDLCKKNADAAKAGTIDYSVLTASDIDAILKGSDIAPVPTDPEGHGTHVASLAAGNGGAEQKYVGMAPEASLVLVKAADEDGFIDNAAIPAAASLVFSLAERTGAAAGLPRVPAVVNLSLGTDFGNHDGSSALERSLAELVGGDHPGRAIVAAAGNSAGLSTQRSAYPSPLGIHTEINIPERSSERVPLVTQTERDQTSVSGAILVWISFRPGDDVAVGVDQNDGPIVPVVHPGNFTEHTDPGLSIAVVNQALKAARIAPENANAAAVIVSGTWAAGRTFAIRLEGHGTANLWVQTSGALGDEGAAFPAATKESTISMPAASAAVIAVGATLNRTQWTDRAGSEITVPLFGGVKNPAPDSVAFFSAAGPTVDLRLKPDIVAPGAFVVGAMSQQADPNDSPKSVFVDPALCDGLESDCKVVDDEHAVLSGTSMAAPIVTGAVALLFEEKPDRTHEDIVTLLQAGARFPKGLIRVETQLGAGALDLEGILDVERASNEPVNREPSGDTSWLSLGASQAHPDPDWRIPALLELRDQQGLVADGFDGPLSIEVDRGVVTEKLARAAPGLYRFAVAPDDATGNDTLHVAVVYRENVLLSKEIPIAVDVNVARAGFFARGGCSVGRRSSLSVLPLLAAALTALLGRRYRSAVRTVRNRDRKDRSARARRDSCRQ